MKRFFFFVVCFFSFLGKTEPLLEVLLFQIASGPQRIFISEHPGALVRSLLSAVCVAIVVVVLALGLLVAEQVAPPAAGVVHLFGRAGALGLPHSLRGKTSG